MNQFFPVAFAIVTISILVEFLISKQTHRAYDWSQARASLFVAAGYTVTKSLAVVVQLPVYDWVYQHKIATVPGVWWAYPLIFILADFVWYWQHRLQHSIPWLWAHHSVHHTAPEINMAVGLRLPWTTTIAGHWLLLLPLMLFGFEPGWVVGAVVLNLGYQFFLHTELVGRIGGWYEFCFNSPSHHRVHHAMNSEYQYRNYAGVFIIWDRLFGTFVAERDDIDHEYGVMGRVASTNPFRLAFEGWVELARQVGGASGFIGKLRTAFEPRRLV